MVATVEIVIVVLFAVLGLWWFLRSNLYKSHRRAGSDPGQRGTHQASDLPYGGTDHGPR